MHVLAQIVVWLNAVTNALGRIILAPIALLPGWLSATIIGAVTGLVMLIAFKYTSNQRGIKAARDDIKANLLALKLFKDNVGVTLRAQGYILLGAVRLLVHAIVPMAVMAVPMTMLLAQLALWYQARPMRIGEEAVMTVKLNGEPGASWPKITLQPTDAALVAVGPVHVASKREVCWNIRARAAGLHRLVFSVDGQDIDKELAIGGGFMRVSTVRPNWSWSDALLNPWEHPFSSDSPVQSIEIDYPNRASWTSGTDTWVIYWFAVSLVAAFLCRGMLGVNL
jgi:hypothetical protein